MRQILCVFSFFVLCAAATSCFAGSTSFDSVDGYKISLDWAQTRKGNDEILRVDGTVEGGEPCGQLNVHLYFSNTGDGRSVARAVGAVSDYNPEYEGSFSAQDILDGTKKRNEAAWIVEDIRVNCIQ